MVAGVPSSRHTVAVWERPPPPSWLTGPEFCLTSEFGHLVPKYRFSLSVPPGTCPGPGLLWYVRSHLAPDYERLHLYPILSLFLLT